MKLFRWFLLLGIFALMLSMGAVAALAADSDPVIAPYVDNGVHSINANSGVWYRFEYTGDHSQIMVKLVNALHDGLNQGLSFQVYTPSQMQDWWKHDGIGAGNRLGNDLIWTGNAHESGTWWVKVMNSNPAPMTFTLVVSGDKVSFVPPGTAPRAAAAPSVGTLLKNENPDNAIAVDSNALVIPGKTTLWYRFAYTGTHDQAILTVPDGGKNFLRVEVYTPEQMQSWWNETPIGQATPNGDDLLWSGNADQGGYWYVQVINDNAAALNFKLLLQILPSNIR